MRLLLLIPFIFLFVSCGGVDGNETGVASQSLVCFIESTETYTIGTDPTVDFVVNNVARNVTFDQVTCPGVATAPIVDTISRVQRTPGQLTIVDNEGQASQLVLQLPLFEGQISSQINVTNIGACTLIRAWDGTIDSDANTISVRSQNEYSGDCSAIFP
ncbi:MAG: hypothetical protein HRT44_07725 [Bdellovibrionales bacterium]|nr:hypothetical protein [Bdellovibrionales bacterium]NQZ19127.1 hypothetical protein [Bdellovibrionales bacterium]